MKTTNPPLQWETVRRQATIYGWVVDAENKPIANAMVSLVSQPDEFSRRLLVTGEKAGMEKKAKTGIDQTITRQDGRFYFLDLPDGKYTLKAIDMSSGLVGQQDAEVNWDKNQNVNKVMMKIKLTMKIN